MRWGKFRAWQIFTKVLGLAILVLGLMGVVEGTLKYCSFVPSWAIDLHKKMGAELIGIGLTILIIDTANDRRMDAQEKRELILRTGSPYNTIAVEAVRKLRARGWHKKTFWRSGVLKGSNLQLADLENAPLQDTDLRDCCLCHAELPMANLINSDLSGADLTDADLREADLTDAQVSSEQLEKAASIEGTTLPDGTQVGES